MIYSSGANSLDKANHLSGYEKQRELEIAEEHRREIEVFEKVLKKSKQKEMIFSFLFV